MRVHDAIGWLAATSLLWANVAAATSPNPPSAMDSIYLELGRGDTADAAAQAATLLTHSKHDDAYRAGIFQAQLDICVAREELNKPPCATLAPAISAYAKNQPGSRIVQELPIAQALERGEAKVALNLTQAALRTASPADLSEWQAVAARVAAQVPGQLPLARQQAEAALPAWHSKPGIRARWLESEMYYIIANVYTVSGSQADALKQLDAGSQIVKATFGENSAAGFRFDADRAAALGNLGRQHEAMEVREALLVSAQKRYGDQSFEVAKAEGLLGANLQEIGDYPAARIHYERAQVLIAANPDAPPLERGLIAANYANLLQEMGKEPEAIAQYRHALELWGDGETTMHARAIVSANMGNTEFRLQNYSAAIEDFERALALREKSDGKESPGLAYSLEGLGSSSLALKQYAAAEGYYRRALAVRSKALTPNHPTIAPLKFGLALARWGQGDEADAFAIAVETAEHQQALLSIFAADFSERQSVAYRELLMPATALTVTLAARRGDGASIATAWRLAMVERGLVARTEAHRLAAARAQTDPQLAAAFDSWRRANSTLGEAWMSKQVDTERIAQLRADTERAERALWSRVGRTEIPSATAAVEVADIARSLPKDSVLIAYTEGVVDDPGRQLTAGDKQAPEDWYAFALGADGNPRLHRVGDIQSLSVQARTWYQDLRNPGADTARLRSEGLALRKALLDPQLDARAKRLFVVPEGDLYRLSFAALPDRDHGYLIESGLSVHTLAHESDLTLPAAKSGGSQTTLLAGAPDFAVSTLPAPIGERTLCAQASREGFAAIPNAGRELDDLHTVLSGISADAQIELIRGSAATKQNVLAAMTHANIVHLATHGFSMDKSCASATPSRGVVLNAETPEESSDVTRNSALSGLAFSGASVADAQAPVGVISAGELATLDLSQVSWITLSACDSGLGPIGRNEGVFGMRRALRLAGARTVVMSLWEVDDATTADLMGALYRQRFVDHADVPDAMARAMRSVIASRRAAHLPDHPYYWAAFIGEGDWR